MVAKAVMTALWSQAQKLLGHRPDQGPQEAPTQDIGWWAALPHSTQHTKAGVMLALTTFLIDPMNKLVSNKQIKIHPVK